MFDWDEAWREEKSITIPLFNLPSNSSKEAVLNYLTWSYYYGNFHDNSPYGDATMRFTVTTEKGTVLVDNENYTNIDGTFTLAGNIPNDGSTYVTIYFYGYNVEGDWTTTSTGSSCHVYAYYIIE